MGPAEAGEVDLQVSAHQVLLAKAGAPATAASARVSIEVSKLRELVSSSAKAKYSKKNRRMSVTIVAK